MPSPILHPTTAKHVWTQCQSLVYLPFNCFCGILRDAMIIFLFQLLFLNKRAQIRRGLPELFTTALEFLYEAALGSLNSNLDQQKANHHIIVQSSEISSFYYHQNGFHHPSSLCCPGSYHQPSQCHSPSHRNNRCSSIVLQ